MKLIASVDAILEDLVNSGKCISVVFDDNGNWAISDIGTLSIGNSSDEVCITNIVLRKYFQPTLEKALIYYLTENEYYQYLLKD